MRFVAALDTRIYGVPYLQGAEVDTLNWSRKQLLTYLNNGTIQASALTAGSITDSLEVTGDGVSQSVDSEGKLVFTIDPALSTLSDVDMTDLEDGNVPVWSEDDGLWLPGEGGGGGGGGASPWVKRVELPLTTLTGWTVGNGTWTVATGQIEQTATTAAAKRLSLDIPIDTKTVVVEVEVKVASPTGLHQAGLIVGFPGPNGTNGLGVQLHRPNSGAAAWTTLTVEEEAVTGVGTFTLAAPITNTNYVKLRVEVQGDSVSTYINDVFIGTTRDVGKRGILATNIGLLNYGCAATFRNLKVWTPPGVSEISAPVSILDKDPLLVLPPGWVSIDEFDSDTMHAAWARVDGTGAAVGNCTWTQGSGVMSLYQNGGDANSTLHGLMRPVAAIGGPLATGDALVTAMTLMGGPATAYVMAGLVVSDGVAHGAGNQAITLNYTGAQQTNDARAFTNWNTQAASSTAVTTTPGVLTFVRLVNLGSNTWRQDVSPDCVSWIKGGTTTKTLTQTHFGFLSSSWASAVKGVVRFDFLRRMSGVT